MICEEEISFISLCLYETSWVHLFNSVDRTSICYVQ
jgi:hypothetical protein